MHVIGTGQPIHDAKGKVTGRTRYAADLTLPHMAHIAMIFSSIPHGRVVSIDASRALELEGVLLTMYDGRTNFSAQVAQEVRRHFPGKVFTTMIPRNVRLAEAPSHGLPVTAYDRSSRGADAYLRLAQEILVK